MDLKTFMMTIKRFSSHIVMKLLVMPMALLLFGVTYGSRLGKVNVLGTFILLIFVVLSQFLEHYFYLQQTKKGTINWQSAYPIIALNVLLILLMFPLTNAIFSILALTYFVSILLVYGFFKLRGTLYFIVIQVFLKGLVLTVLSVFMQINFISYELIFATVPILFLLLFYFSEIEKLEVKQYRALHASLSSLNLLSLLGWLGTLSSPIALMRLVLNNYFMLLLWGIAGAIMLKVMLDNKKKTQFAKQKNFMATIFSCVILIYCFI
ncbi:hypothetical protein KG090_04560 [Carnobacteriaceae bacterium zg-ZUI240]|nr:hypothetical protein [Carnobacteriaceae bacterium zg-ZUI240]